MATSDPMTILLAHDRWATGELLKACAGLTPEQFHQRFDMGPGSLHDTVTHILGALKFLGELLDGKEPSPRLEKSGGPRTVGELQALSEELSDAFEGAARRYPLETLATRTRDGKTYQFTHGALITHITTHAMHHRAQCLNMLRRLGVTTLPKSSVMEWSIMADPAGTAG